MAAGTCPGGVPILFVPPTKRSSRGAGATHPLCRAGSSRSTYPWLLGGTSTPCPLSSSPQPCLMPQPLPKSPPPNTCILGWLRPPRQLAGLQGCLPLPSRSRSARAGGFRSRSVPKPPPINLPPSPAPSPPRWAASWGGSIDLGSVQTQQLELGVCRHLLQVAGHRRGCCLHI